MSRNLCAPRALAASLCVCLLASFASADSIVRFQTNYGNIDLQLYDTAAPNTVANFLRYVNDGWYDYSTVHRSVPGFVIQGGMDVIRWQDDVPGVYYMPTYDPIENEFSPDRSNLAGTIAMARQSGDPNSATSQWFINMNDNVGLDDVDGGFTVFGHVLAGWDVCLAIQNLDVYDLTVYPQWEDRAWQELPLGDAYDPDAGLYLSDLVLVYDAYVTPEPASLCLLAVGGLALLRRRRRR